jgi:hypothetical protein
VSGPIEDLLRESLAHSRRSAKLSQALAMLLPVVETIGNMDVLAEPELVAACEHIGEAVDALRRAHDVVEAKFDIELDRIRKRLGEETE